MKLIIEIDEETYKKCKWKNNGVVGLEWWESAIANGTPIPDNATNGDVITEILKSSNDMHSTRYIGLAQEDTIYIEVGSNWWNAPYQKGGKE